MCIYIYIYIYICITALTNHTTNNDDNTPTDRLYGSGVWRSTLTDPKT